MPDDLPDIFGICREPECGHVWTTEPEDPPRCPNCGCEEWPLSPAEAEARISERRMRKLILGNSENDAESRRSYPNGPCPNCKTGTLKKRANIDQEHLRCDSCHHIFVNTEFDKEAANQKRFASSGTPGKKTGAGTLIQNANDGRTSVVMEDGTIKTFGHDSHIEILKSDGNYWDDSKGKPWSTSFMDWVDDERKKQERG